jgi:hypothetical protein
MQDRRKKIQKEKRLKDRAFVDAVIKITKKRMVFKMDSCWTKYQDWLILADIRKRNCKVSTCFEDNRKGRRQLLRFIKEEMHY